MPEGNKQMYGAGYIMGQMSQQGEMSDANEASSIASRLSSTL